MANVKVFITRQTERQTDKNNLYLIFRYGDRERHGVTSSATTCLISMYKYLMRKGHLRPGFFEIKIQVNWTT
jgi:hypothetical protein